MKKFALSAIALALLILALPASVRADTITFHITSEHPNSVRLEFSSQTRNNRFWPGGDEVYIIKDYQTHAYPLNCRSGEKNCYGAWVDGNSSVYWGVGRKNAYGCKGCCATCQNGDVRYTLAP